MAIVDIIGLETQQAAAEGNTVLTGTASINTNASFVRTGLASVRCNPASGVSGSFDWTGGAATRVGFGFYIASLPSVGRRMAGDVSSNSLSLETDGKVSYFDGTSNVGQSAPLSTGTWYWVAWVAASAFTGTLLTIDGAVAVTGTSGTMGSTLVGFTGTEASAVDCYFDDLIGDDANLPVSCKVVLLVPISDNANTAWTRGAGVTTTGLFNPVSTRPPPGVVSASETDSTNIESASNTGTANYIANLTTYSTAGIVAADTILAVRLLIQEGEDISTGVKTGSYESTANPVIASATFTFGNASAHGTSPTNWSFQSVVAASPSVTLGSSLTMKVIKTDTTTRVACVDFMGAYVAYTPGVTRVPHSSPYPQYLAQ